MPKAVPLTTASLTPPSSSHGNPGGGWDSVNTEKHSRSNRDPTLDTDPQMAISSAHNGASPASTNSTDAAPTSRKQSLGDLSGVRTNSNGSYSKHSRSNTADYSTDAPSTKRKGASDERLKRSNSDLHDEDQQAEESKWIHRDKLAKIESEELLAAGIVIPRPMPKPRRDRSVDKAAAGYRRAESTERASSKPRSASIPEIKPMSPEISNWDFRLPEEIAAEVDAQNTPSWSVATAVKSGSRIPVPKSSLVPVTVDNLDRDPPANRKHNSDTSGDGDSIFNPRSRSRSTSIKTHEHPDASGSHHTGETSPKKNATSRKVSAPAKTGSGAHGAGRPKTRGASNKDSISSNAGHGSGGGNSNTSTNRPSTRSGELSLGSKKQLEGEPPWMVSAYQPDPRLPPDQQLLPTVARRLQQEKWEKEGKFGNVYDTDFRPLKEGGFPQRPEETTGGPSDATDDAESSDKRPSPLAAPQGGPTDDWPLKPDAPKSPSLRHGGSYSTMPKIEKQPPTSPLIGSLSPQPNSMRPMHSNPPPPQIFPDPPASIQEPAAGNKQRLCGCCIVM